MENVGRDAYVESLFRKVREKHGEWGAVIGPHAELLASITTARAVCTAWRSEVKPHPKPLNTFRFVEYLQYPGRFVWFEVVI